MKVSIFQISQHQSNNEKVVGKILFGSANRAEKDRERLSGSVHAIP